MRRILKFRAFPICNSFLYFFFIDSFLVCNSFHIMYCTIEGLDEGIVKFRGFRVFESIHIIHASYEVTSLRPWEKQLEPAIHHRVMHHHRRRNGLQNERIRSQQSV